MMAIVSAHSYFSLEGRPFFTTAKGTWVPELIALFNESELVDTTASSEGDELVEYGYVTRVHVLLDRLELQGFTSAYARDELDAAVEKATMDGSESVPQADAILSSLKTFMRSADGLATFVEPAAVLWHLDGRAFVRLALDLAWDDRLEVRYDLDELAWHRIINSGSTIADDARRFRRSALALDAPLVVLTEGSSDSYMLSAGLKVTHPHLVNFLRFMNFSGSAEGSAGNLAKLVRSFIGAGIANRVVALADNDTAAHDAFAKLKNEGVPDSYRLVHYPDLPILERYPTLGPQSDDPVIMNVNGKAGSLEMYLGDELLTVQGELVPVQWSGYFEGQRSYQGTIAPREKSRVQKGFHAKVDDVLRNPAKFGDYDWFGVTEIINAILRAFS